MPTPLMHYICWFSQGTDAETGFVPTDGGCHHEADQVAWEMAELLRNVFGINLSAFVPILDDIGEVDPRRLPPPERCLEVFSEAMLEAAGSTPSYPIKDLFNLKKEIPGEAFVDWLEAYRKYWRQGYYIVRVPDKGGMTTENPWPT